MISLSIHSLSSGRKRHIGIETDGAVVGVAVKFDRRSACKVYDLSLFQSAVIFIDETTQLRYRMCTSYSAAGTG